MEAHSVPFYVVDDHPLWLFVLMLILPQVWPVGAPYGQLLCLYLICPHYLFSTVFWHKIPGFFMYFPAPDLESAFFRGIRFLSMTIGTQRNSLGTRYVVVGVLLHLGPLAGQRARAPVCMYTRTHTHICTNACVFNRITCSCLFLYLCIEKHEFIPIPPVSVWYHRVHSSFPLPHQ